MAKKKVAVAPPVPKTYHAEPAPGVTLLDKAAGQRVPMVEDEPPGNIEVRLTAPYTDAFGRVVPDQTPTPPRRSYEEKMRIQEANEKQAPVSVFSPERFAAIQRIQFQSYAYYRSETPPPFFHNGKHWYYDRFSNKGGLQIAWCLRAIPASEYSGSFNSDKNELPQKVETVAGAFVVVEELLCVRKAGTGKGKKALAPLAVTVEEREPFRLFDPALVQTSYGGGILRGGFAQWTVSGEAFDKVEAAGGGVVRQDTPQAHVSFNRAVKAADVQAAQELLYKHTGIQWKISPNGSGSVFTADRLMLLHLTQGKITRPDPTLCIKCGHKDSAHVVSGKGSKARIICMTYGCLPCQ